MIYFMCACIYVKKNLNSKNCLITEQTILLGNGISFAHISGIIYTKPKNQLHMKAGTTFINIGYSNWFW